MLAAALAAGKQMQGADSPARSPVRCAPLFVSPFGVVAIRALLHAFWTPPRPTAPPYACEGIKLPANEPDSGPEAWDEARRQRKRLVGGRWRQERSPSSGEQSSAVGTAFRPIIAALGIPATPPDALLRRVSRRRTAPGGRAVAAADAANWRAPQRRGAGPRVPPLPVGRADHAARGGLHAALPVPVPAPGAAGRGRTAARGAVAAPRTRPWAAPHAPTTRPPAVLPCAAAQEPRQPDGGAARGARRSQLAGEPGSRWALPVGEQQQEAARALNQHKHVRRSPNSGSTRASPWRLAPPSSPRLRPLPPPPPHTHTHTPPPTRCKASPVPGGNSPRLPYSHLLLSTTPPVQGFLTGLGGNSLLLSYFAAKQETNAVVVQALGVASSFAVAHPDLRRRPHAARRAGRAGGRRRAAGRCSTSLQRAAVAALYVLLLLLLL